MSVVPPIHGRLAVDDDQEVGMAELEGRARELFYAEIRGHIVEDTHDGAEEQIDRLAKKYLGVDTYPGHREGEQRVKFLIEPDHIRLAG
jgi:hypothetical protein